MKYPNTNEITTCSARMNLSAFEPSMRPWSAIRRRLNRIVQFPSVSVGNISDRLYGIDVMGDVPSDALVMAAMPNDITMSPIRKTM